MKKIILVVLLAVMITTLCFAQEVEPEGIFTIGGTIWEALPMGIQILPSPSLVSLDWGFGFYGGEVYNLRSPSFYIDMLVCGIFWGVGGGIGGGYPPIYFGILQPIGIGMVIQYNVAPFPIKDLTVGLVIKTDNNWTPSDVE